MNTFPVIPAILPTASIEGLSPEAQEFRERIIAAMTILTAGIVCIANDCNAPENQKTSALIGEEAEDFLQTFLALGDVIFYILEGRGDLQIILETAEDSRQRHQGE